MESDSSSFSSLSSQSSSSSTSPSSSEEEEMNWDEDTTSSRDTQYPESPVNFDTENDEEVCRSRSPVEKTEKKESNFKCICNGQKADEDDDKTCSICLDDWTTSGEHRVCALKCGHLFGHACVLRWLATQRSCPTCKVRARKNDVRFIYASKVAAVDNSELTAAKEETNRERAEKNRIQLELIQAIQREEVLKSDILVYKQQITNFKLDTAHNNRQSASRNKFIIYKNGSFDINKEGGCRVMDYYQATNSFAVSCSSCNPLFSGFGIKKFTLPNFKHPTFIPLHSNVIRDLAYHPKKELLLSVSIDNYLKITDTNNNKIVSSLRLNSPIWSCCWDIVDPNYFYVGLQLGTAAKYDSRMLNDKLFNYSVMNDYSPVVSLAYAASKNEEILTPGGLVMCKLNSCSMFSSSNTSSMPIPLHVDGPFVSMRYDNTSKFLLISTRPNNRVDYVRHSVFSVDKITPISVNCHPIRVFQGAPNQQLLTRSCPIGIGDEFLVAAHNEKSRHIDIWRTTSGEKLCQLSANTAVLDLQRINVDNVDFLCSLTDKKVDMFKIDQME